MTEVEPVGDELQGAVYANNFRTVHHGVRATGLRTNAFTHESVGDPASARPAEEFLIASRLARRDIGFDLSVGAYFSPSGVAMSSRVGEESGPLLPLPDPVPLSLQLGASISRRHSVRAYSGDPMPLAQLSALTAACCGVTHGDAADPRLRFRAVASAGALYPVDLWVVALRVDGLERGIYAYDPRTHAMRERVAPGRADALVEALAVPDDLIMVSRACLVALFVARPWRSMRKYGARGMRHVFLEAGAMAAHLNLAATALGFGGVDCSSVYDDDAHEVLDVDGVHEALVHATVVGVPA